MGTGLTQFGGPIPGLQTKFRIRVNSNSSGQDPRPDTLGGKFVGKVH